MWTSAAFFVGHMFATCAFEAVEVTFHQGHLAQNLWTHKDILSCQILVKILAFMGKLQRLEAHSPPATHISLITHTLSCPVGLTKDIPQAREHQ